MKARISRAALHEACSRTVGAAGKDGLTSNLHLSLDDGLSWLTATATNHALSIRHSVACDVGEPGEALVPARTLASIVAVLPQGGTVEIERRDAGGLHLACGRAHYDLESAPGEEFPQVFRSVQGAVQSMLPAELVRRAFAVTAPFALVDGAAKGRSSLEAVALVFASDPNGVRVEAVSTDGTRLSVFRRVVDVEMGAGAYRVHQPGAAELARLLATDDAQEVGLTLSPKSPRVVFDVGASRLEVRLLDDEFPDYRRVIPADDGKRCATVDRAELVAAARRVGALSSERMISLRFDRLEATLEGKRAGAGHAVDAVACEWSGAPGHTFGIDVRALQEALALFSGAIVRLTHADSTAPLLLTCDEEPDLLHVCMPMRM